MSEELKPCPFCGGEAKAFYDDAGGVYEVQCQECWAEPYLGSRSGAPGMRTLGDVIKAWNRRAERTCRVESSHEEEGDGCYSYFEYELTCGHEMAWGDQLPPSYCPECGRRVLYDCNDYI